jgi:carbon monoxide dehydrogenase subunit G
MASIIKAIELSVPADAAWAMLRDVGGADKAFPGVLTASRLAGDIRTVNFASGMEVKERIVNIDEANRRVAYGVIEGRFTHHHASVQILAKGEDECRFVWISDFLPDETEPLVRGLVDQGAAAFKTAVEDRG